LLQLGNEKALDKDVVAQAAAQAAVTAPSQTAVEAVIDAASDLGDTSPEEIKREADIIKELTRVLDNPSEKINPEIRAPYLLESEPLEESGNPAFEEFLEGLEAEKLEEGTFITNPEVLGTGLITRRRGRK
jgi:hypothetical protein